MSAVGLVDVHSVASSSLLCCPLAAWFSGRLSAKKDRQSAVEVRAPVGLELAGSNLEGSESRGA
jgi:hypothetical protein